jgi:hypothetical protein
MYLYPRVKFAINHWLTVRIFTVAAASCATLPALAFESARDDQKDAAATVHDQRAKSIRLRSNSIFEPNTRFPIQYRLLSFTLLLADVLFVHDLYEIIGYYTKPKTRLLTDKELALGKSIFGNSINWDIVTIDIQSTSSKRMRAIYVSFNTINCNAPISNAILAHELVHIWQYQHFGASYIPKALAAQRTQEGYNYAHNPNWKSATSIFDFNAEQMGDIVEDYYKLLQGEKTQWGNSTSVDLPHYRKLIGEIITKTDNSHSA